MPVEQLLLLALFMLAALAQLLYRRFTRGPRDEAAGKDQAPGRDRIAAPPAAPTRVPERRPRPRAEPGRDARPTPVAPIGARPPARSRLGTLRDVRRGIVLMTVLGPCRALEAAPLTARSPEGDIPHQGVR
jgi:hypothetical protein